MREKARRYGTGEKITDHITVVGAIDDGGKDPVYIVWHHGAWCAMCCKVYHDGGQARWEARALAALSHPGIVRLIENGAPSYLLMEFLEGPTLRRLIRSRPRGRLGIDDSLRVAIHLGAALTHLHARGFAHLDVKPGNVIVRAGRPMLFDLGSARSVDGRKLRTPQGTDAYMSPEQCRCEPPTPACDIYGLGVTLFEMLTGSRPFPAGTDDEPFPQLRLEPRPLRELLPRAPRALESLVASCLAPRPSDRPSSVAALIPRLHALIRSGPRMWPEDLGGAIAAAPNGIDAPRH
jgi:serine/threonine protein kinase